MNIVGALYSLTCVFRPSRLLPTLSVDEFSDLPLNIADALAKSRHSKQELDIRALVLDKDNCFAEPDALVVASKYLDRWRLIRQQFPGDKVLIVSNSAGTLDDPSNLHAQELQKSLATNVLVHKVKKPACHTQIMQHLRQSEAQLNDASQVVVIGDRLFTDVLMANIMGAHSIWIRHGTIKNSGFLTRLETAIYRYLTTR